MRLLQKAACVYRHCWGQPERHASPLVRVSHARLSYVHPPLLAVGRPSFSAGVSVVTRRRRGGPRRRPALEPVRVGVVVLRASRIRLPVCLVVVPLHGRV